MFRAVNKETVTGAIWWDTPTQETLAKEKSQKLVDFTELNFPATFLIWERELMVDPIFQKIGIAFRLRGSFIKTVRNFAAEVLILTRMRDDNQAVIKIGERLNFQKTGIKIASSQKADIFHEYWFCSFKKITM